MEATVGSKKKVSTKSNKYHNQELIKIIRRFFNALKANNMQLIQLTNITDFKKIDSASLNRSQI